MGGGGLKGAADREQDPDLVVRKFVYLICVFAPCFFLPMLNSVLLHQGVEP